MTTQDSARIVLGDDFLALMAMGVSGHAAFGIFAALVLVARQTGNSGVFEGSLERVAPLLGVATKDLQQAFCIIAKACKSVRMEPWLLETPSCLTISSFSVWNQIFAISSNPTGLACVTQSEQRAKVRLLFMARLGRLFGRFEGGRFPTSAPQFRADVTSAKRLFDSIIWPEDSPPPDLKLLWEIVDQSSRRDVPMAYLTKRAKQVFGGAPSSFISQSS